jgi:hypothetical protein
VAGPVRRRAAGRRRPGQGRLDPPQQCGEGVGVVRRKRGDQRLEARADELLGGAQEALAVRGQRQPPAAAVVAGGALDRPRPLEPGDEL